MFNLRFMASSLVNLVEHNLSCHRVRVDKGLCTHNSISSFLVCVWCPKHAHTHMHINPYNNAIAIKGWEDPSKKKEGPIQYYCYCRTVFKCINVLIIILYSSGGPGSRLVRDLGPPFFAEAPPIHSVV